MKLEVGGNRVHGRLILFLGCGVRLISEFLYSDLSRPISDHGPGGFTHSWDVGLGGSTLRDREYVIGE